ncbi:MAG: hypothetical protein WDN66_05550 [Candidatus Saccharibacteria bacterium]
MPGIHSPELSDALANRFSDVGELLESMQDKDSLAKTANLAQATADRTMRTLTGEVALLRMSANGLFGKNVLLQARKAYQLEGNQDRKYFALSPNYGAGGLLVSKLTGYLGDVDVFDRFKVEEVEGLTDDIDETSRFAVSLKLYPNVIDHLDYEVPNITYVPASSVTSIEAIEML